MAPRKPASPAKPRRVTRARAANADTETKPTLDDAPKRKATLSKAVPTTSQTKAIEAKTRITKKTDTKTSRTSTRSGKQTAVEVMVDDNKEEDIVDVAVVQPAVKATRATRTTAAISAKPATSTLATAPRRRIRVTPLDTTTSEPAAPKEVKEKPEKKTSAKEKREKTNTSSTTTARGKREAVVASVEDDNNHEEVVADEPEPKRRGRSRTTKAEAVEATAEPSTAARKGRGRPKKTDTTAQSKDEIPVVTRQTRARAGSSVSAALPEATINVAVPARKKVTFQDLPDEDDEKENKQPATLSKSRAAKKGASTAKATTKSDTATKGMRAKPIRKPAASKATRSTRDTSKTVQRPEVEDPEKLMPRVLTPKKITQVAKAMPMDSEDELEDNEKLAADETPVRSLSQSPKRPHALPMSPVKTLDLAPTLKSPEKQADAPGIMSPPRRLPSSPIKDSLKESPRRAPEGVTVFRAQMPDSHNAALALNPSSTNHHSQLLQSPKRGICDNITFPPSAMKSRNSPTKTALLASPARRLFSPSKQKSPVAHVSPTPGDKQKSTSDEQLASPGDVDIVMSSHFRPSVSPQRSGRVYKISEDELAQQHGLGGGLDFDQSVLDVRSPLKVEKVKPLSDVSVEAMDVDMPEQNETTEQHDNPSAETLEGAQNAEKEPTAAPEIDSEETVLDPALEEEEGDDGNDVFEEDVQPHSTLLPASEEIPAAVNDAFVKQPRMSDAVFRRLREVDEESEDELAAEQTPDNRLLRPHSRPSLSAANIRSRLSMGIAPQSASRNMGFTPLAAQVRGWRAASPEKRVAPEGQDGLFSPAARMHIAGAVELNRQDTPAREAQKRKSLAGRLSFAPSMTGSPVKPDFFDEGMAAREFEDQMDVHVEAAPLEEADLHDLVPTQPSEVEDAGSDEQSDEDTDSPAAEREPGELTTDLIKFTNASDTAMVDFAALATEAEVLAGEEGVEQEAGIVEPQDEGAGASVLPIVEEEESVLSTSSDLYGDENAAPIEQEPVGVVSTTSEDVEVEDNAFVGQAPSVASQHEDEIEQDRDASFVSHQAEAVAISEGDLSTAGAVSPAASVDVRSSVEMDFNVTPVRPGLSLPRVVHTVSKVPLRPEGQIPSTFSPVKVQRKRPRSMSSSNSLAVKRRSLGTSPKTQAVSADTLATPKGSHLGSSPQRRIRSAAPSPADSLATGMTTPGQMSFAIEDFGDSTLDGIEIPDDELLSDEDEEVTEKVNADDSVLTIGSALFKTPTVPTKRTSMAPPSSTVSQQAATPHYAMSTRSSRRRSIATPSRAAAAAAAATTRTPATAMTTRTPAAATKAATPRTTLKSKTPAKTPVTRTPLRTVGGGGVLSGAIVHYDIHTSEGSDASAFYVELLTAMGARCVKEWRWNPRASIGSDAGSANGSGGAEQEMSSAVGITHVVYKDGGKRTLEKVRTAGGQVLCVGVNWVLDCYNEQKWLDETRYTVDASVLPRGGSRRRKSMEPRTLMKNENGSLMSMSASASKYKARMSLPAGLGLGLGLAGGRSAAPEEVVHTDNTREGQGQVEIEDKENTVEAQVEIEDKETTAEAEIDGEPDNGDEVHNANDNDISMTSAYDDSYADEFEDSYGFEDGHEYDSFAAATVGEGGETMGGVRLAGQQQQQDESVSVLDLNGGMTTQTQTIQMTPLLKAREGGVHASASALGPSVSTPQSALLQVDYDPRTAATPITPFVPRDTTREDNNRKVQMSAPAKQVNRSLFDQQDDEQLVAGSAGGGGRKEKAKSQAKFQIKNRNKVADGRRKTMGAPMLASRDRQGQGHRPVVGSPLRRE